LPPKRREAGPFSAEIEAALVCARGRVVARGGVEVAVEPSPRRKVYTSTSSEVGVLRDRVSRELAAEKTGDGAADVGGVMSSESSEKSESAPSEATDSESSSSEKRESVLSEAEDSSVEKRESDPRVATGSSVKMESKETAEVRSARFESSSMETSASSDAADEWKLKIDDEWATAKLWTAGCHMSSVRVARTADEWRHIPRKPLPRA
jgi:hypothetical protein